MVAAVGRHVSVWVALWALPTPVDVLLAPFVAAVLTVWWAVVTISRNVGQLGPLWVVCYWVVLWVLLGIGAHGRDRGREIFKGGEDVAAFAPGGGRASWLGFGAQVIRLDAVLQAWSAATCAVVGTGGAAVVIVVGLLWWWLVPLFLGLSLLAWRQRQPKPWE